MNSEDWEFKVQEALKLRCRGKTSEKRFHITDFFSFFLTNSSVLKKLVTLILDTWPTDQNLVSTLFFLHLKTIYEDVPGQSRG